MNHELNNQQNKGFTIIELVLAMTLISLLLLGIAMTIVQIANIYNHGMIAKEVNQTSRALGDELTSALRTNGSFSTDPVAHRYVSTTSGGRLCVGQYSYIWNYAKALNSLDTNRNKFLSSAPSNPGTNRVKLSNGSFGYEISFVKLPDGDGAYCTPNGSGAYPDVNPADAVELLKTGNHSLGLHAFSVVSTPTAQDSLSNQQLYRFVYTIGTSDLAALNTTQTACRVPGETGADPNYCSIEQFTLVLRAVGGVN